MNAIIIEDDPYARDLLIEIISGLDEKINIVDTALTLKQGIIAIQISSLILFF